MQRNLFYETTALNTAQREKAVARNLKQKELVLTVFKTFDRAFTPLEVHEALYRMGYDILIGSIRRTITSLTYDEKLTKLGTLKMERNGSPNSQWILRK